MVQVHVPATVWGSSPFDGTNRFNVQFLLISFAPAKDLGARLGSRAIASLAVGHPNIFHLRGVLQIPSSFALRRIEPVDGAAFVGPHLFEISNRHRFR